MQLRKPSIYASSNWRAYEAWIMRANLPESDLGGCGSVMLEALR